MFIINTKFDDHRNFRLTQYAIISNKNLTLFEQLETYVKNYVLYIES